MVKVNCAALPAALIEAELFGHERGAFTGAVKLRRGRFELADGGTILLDEVTELSQDLQGKLLRVLQEGEIERIGGDRTIKVDVRVIAATNRRLGDEVARGRFRQDLYYRLHVYPITVPPLRRRKEDIPVLASAFVRRFALAQGKAVDRIPRAVLDELVRYDWPGNVRELQNVIEQAVITTRGRSLRLAARLTRPVERREEPGDPRYEGTLDEIERRYIRRVLDLCGWRIEGAGKAAELLGMHPNTLRFRMAKLGIRRPVPGPAPDQAEPADGQPDNEPRHAVVSPHAVASAPATPADRIGRDV
jgi:formate hydrogenlyase transcriptional activator